MIGQHRKSDVQVESNQMTVSGRGGVVDIERQCTEGKVVMLRMLLIELNRAAILSTTVREKGQTSNDAILFSIVLNCKHH